MALRYLDEAPDVLEALARVEVLYTDLDGTLLGRGASVLRDDTGAPTLDTARAIVEVNTAGLTVVMVSGRNFIQLAEDSRLLGWTDFIGEVGALRSTGRERHVEYMLGDWPPDAVPEGITPYEAILEAGALDMLMTAFPGRIERHIPWDADRVVTFILRGEVEIEEAQAILDQIELPVQIVDNGVIHPVNHTLSGVEQIHAYHLVPNGTSKVRTIRDDLEARGLARDQAAAIGDSRADLDMAEAVGVMAIVANGLDVPAVSARLAELPNAVATTEAPGPWMGRVRGRMACGEDEQALARGSHPELHHENGEIPLLQIGLNGLGGGFPHQSFRLVERDCAHPCLVLRDAERVRPHYSVLPLGRRERALVLALGNREHEELVASVPLEHRTASDVDLGFNRRPALRGPAPQVGLDRRVARLPDHDLPTHELAPPVHLGSPHRHGRSG